MQKQPIFVLIALMLFAFILAACSAAVEEDSSGEAEHSTGAREGRSELPGTPPLGPKVTPTRLIPTPAAVGWLDWDGKSQAASAEVRADSGALEASAEGPVATEGEPGEGVENRSASNSQNRLTAGEVDDNVHWDDYLGYLRRYDGPPAIEVDVSARHQISVVDEQGNPVLGALIRVFAGEDEQMTLRTHADGAALFFPSALPRAPQTNQYVFEIEKGDRFQVLEIAADTSQREWEVVLAGVEPPETVRLDILFLIDATGSMADEIQELKDNIAAIAAQIEALPTRPDVRFAMTVYRDQGDEFVSRTFDFTPDVQFFAAGLAQVEAGGGGDYPEDLNTALTRAIHAPEWRVANSASLIFLVADAPPHLDYAQQDATYADEMFEAAARGIKIYPIASSGLDEQGEYVFRQLAQVTRGRFIFLTYGPGGPGTTGTETTHNVEDYTVAALDELIVRIVEQELASLQR